MEDSICLVRMMALATCMPRLTMRISSGSLVISLGIIGLSKPGREGDGCVEWRDGRLRVGYQSVPLAENGVQLPCEWGISKASAADVSDAQGGRAGEETRALSRIDGSFATTIVLDSLCLLSRGLPIHGLAMDSAAGRT